MQCLQSLGQTHLQELGDLNVLEIFSFSNCGRTSALGGTHCPHLFPAITRNTPDRTRCTSDRFPKMDDVRFWPKTFVSIVLSSQIPLRSPSILSTSVKTGVIVLKIGGGLTREGWFCPQKDPSVSSLVRPSSDKRLSLPTSPRETEATIL